MIKQAHTRLVRALPTILVAVVALCSCHNSTDKPSATKGVPPRNT